MFTVSCAPGPAATVDIRQVGPGWQSLVLSMDPGRIVIDAPNVSGGALVLARYCAELARVAARLAVDLDPTHPDHHRTARGRQWKEPDHG